MSPSLDPRRWSERRGSSFFPSKLDRRQRIAEDTVYRAVPREGLPAGPATAMTSVMKKTSEYRAHARECRKLATRMDLDRDRELLMRMAADWERLARDRAELVRRHPELDGANAETQDAMKTDAAGTRR